MQIHYKISLAIATAFSILGSLSGIYLLSTELQFLGSFRQITSVFFLFFLPWFLIGFGVSEFVAMLTSLRPKK